MKRLLAVLAVVSLVASGAYALASAHEAETDRSGHAGGMRGGMGGMMGGQIGPGMMGPSQPQPSK